MGDAAAVQTLPPQRDLPGHSHTAHRNLCPPHRDGYQQRYFLLESFEEGAAQLKAYCRTLHQNVPDDVHAAVGLL